VSRILKLKGSEFTAPTDLANANTAFDSTLIKHYHTAAAVITVTDSANTAIGNTTVSAGEHFIQKAATDKIYASAGLFTPIAFAD
jgi:hypothetical protein